MPSAVMLDRVRGEVGEVLARHRVTRTDFTRYADDPVGFIRDVLHAEPWAAQIEMAELVRDQPRVCVVSANSMGKDWLFARLFLWHVYARRGFVVATSVTDRQARQITMREVTRAWLGSNLPGELLAMELRVGDGSGILAFTSDNIERLVGFHHPRLLLALSEGQGLEPGVFEAAHACATAAENKILAYGNPTRPTGAFHAAATSANWQTLTIPASAHPNIVSGREEIPGGPSRAWVASMAEEYGVTSTVYRSRVLSEWPEESVEGLVRKSWLDAAYARHGDPQPVRERPVVGFDVARFGPDSSVCAVVRGHRVQELVAWRGASITESVEKVIDLSARVRREWCLKFYHPDQLHLVTEPLTVLIVDEPGLGGGAIDLLRARGQPVEAFNGASRPADAARMENTRAEAFWHFRTLLENGTLGLPFDAELEEEALAVEWSINPRGRIQIASKDSMRATLGRSPDKLDAVVMAVYGAISDPRREWRPVTVIY